MAYSKYSYKKPMNVLTSYHMNHDGSIYPILGETYSVKDELKALGAKFVRGLGWFFVDKELAEKCGRPYCEIPVKDIVRCTGVNKFDFIYEEELKAMVEPFQPKVEKETIGSVDSEFIGEVGAEITAEVEIKKVFTFNGRFGESFMFVMEDEDGDTFTWTTKSRNAEDFPEGTTWVVTGKVKEHRVYNDVKQTVLTYCKMT